MRAFKALRCCRLGVFHLTILPESVDCAPLAEDRAAGATALLVIDMLSTWDFPDGDAMLKSAEQIAPRIAELRRRCRVAGVPVIYANDNSGRWRSDFREVVAMAIESGEGGARIAELLRPERDDYFVLKPKHRAFTRRRSICCCAISRCAGCDHRRVGDQCVLTRSPTRACLTTKSSCRVTALRRCRLNATAACSTTSARCRRSQHRLPARSSCRPIDDGDRAASRAARGRPVPPAVARAMIVH